MSNIHKKPAADDDRLVADVIRGREERRWLLVLAVLLCWRMAVKDARAIVVHGEGVDEAGQGWPS